MPDNEREVDPRIIDSLRRKPKTEFGRLFGATLVGDIEAATQHVIASDIVGVEQDVATRVHVESLEQFLEDSKEI